MSNGIKEYGSAVGELVAKHRNEYMLLLATLIMVGGYIFSALMYMDMREFMGAQTKAQIETAHVLSEMNVRLSELEMEHRVQGLKSGEAWLDSAGKK